MTNGHMSEHDAELVGRPQPAWSHQNQTFNRFAFVFVSAVMIALVSWAGMALLGLQQTTTLNTYKIDQIKAQTDAVPSLSQQANMLALQVRTIQGQITDLERRQTLDDIERAKHESH